MSATEPSEPTLLAESADAEFFAREVLKHSADAAVVISPDRGVIYASPAIRSVIGFDPSDAIGWRAADWAHPDDLATMLYHRRAASRLGHSGPVEIRGRYGDADGEVLDDDYRWFEAEWWGLDGADDDTIVLHLRDVTERRAARAAATRGEARMARLMRSSADIVYVIGDDGTIDYLSPSIEKILGWTVHEILSGNEGSLLHPDDRVRINKIATENLRSTAGSAFVGEARVRHCDGSYRWMEITGQNLRADPFVGGVVFHLYDITELREARDALSRSILTDELTGLASRVLVRSRVDQALERGGDPSSVAVLLCDLDAFAVTNDAIGHERGDEILTAIGERLRNARRSGCTIGRLAGDEFVVAVEGLSDLNESLQLAEWVRAVVAEPLPIAGVEHVFTCSIGIAVGVEGANGDSLLGDASVALHAAKSNGPDRVEVFNPDLREAVLQRLGIRYELSSAVAKDQLVLHFQPAYDLASGRVAGTEALVRWNHPERGLLYPGAFIADAEELGLIGVVGQWVIDEAIRTAVRLNFADPANERTMWVNVSVRQLNDDTLADSILASLWKAGLPPHLLGIEVTESTLMKADERVGRNVRVLREAGCRLALDDFGTGYSSLTYLQHLNFDAIKIDQSFVGRLDTDPDAPAIVAAVNGLGKALGLTVIAEGVESLAQLEYLEHIECTKACGFGLCRPIPADELAAVLDQDLAARRRGLQADARVTQSG